MKIREALAVASLPQAKLHTDLPLYGHNRYFAGNQGLTLACNGTLPKGAFR